MKRMNIGKRLYETLENFLKRQGILNMNACIAYPAESSKNISEDSALFHKKMGFSLVGRFHKCGYKFGTWYDMIWMEKHIGKHTDNPQPVKRFRDLFTT